ncbi:ligand-binding sensor domain-containing protein [Pseudidiomarina sp.]|uniref:ligand-binding sensor domain-containing protein n=1 Tax=Pseudidiomarina sp. TaxID=2081707 RepID=UPI003A97D2D4
MYRCILILVALAFCQSAFAGLNFRNLNDEVGSITDVTFDQHGLMWFASRQGIYRYDGTQLQQVSSAQGLSDDDIRKIVVGPDNRLWIGTNSGGLNVYDPETGSVRVYRHSEDSTTLSNDSVYDIAFAENGDVWVATQSGLNRFTTDTQAFQRYFHRPSEGGSIAANYTFSLYIDQQQRLWVATIGGGVSVYNSRLDTFSTVKLSEVTEADASDDVFSVLQVSPESYLLASRSGLYRFNELSNEAHPVTYQGSPIGTATDIVWAKNDVYVSTLNRGVFVYDLESGTLQTPNDAPLGSVSQLPSVPIFDMDVYESQLFVGTWGKGLYAAYLDNSELEAQLIRPTPAGELSNVTALTSSDVGVLAGSFGAGLMAVSDHLQRLEGSTGHTLNQGYRALVQSYPELRAIGVLAVAYSAAHARLYLGTVEGLWVADLKSLQLRKYSRYQEKVIGYVNALEVQENGDVWFGSGGEGLMHLDSSSDVLIAFNEQNADRHNLAGQYVTALHFERDYLWVGTRSNGLSRCTIRPLACQHIDALTGTTTHFNVTAIRALSSGSIVFATRGGGLYEFTPENSSIRHFAEDDGLGSNIILAVEEDVDRSLWLSTSKGLSRLNATRDSIYNYPVGAMLGMAHFNAHSSQADAEHIYFGALEGVVKLKKGTTLPQQQAKTVLLAGQIRNKDETVMVQAGAVTHDVAPQSVIELEFALLDYIETQKLYHYRLAADQEWQLAGSGQQFLLHHLAPGSYNIQVRSRDHAGRWQYSESLGLKVYPYFWQTWWFQVIWLSSLLLMLWWLHKRRTARLAQRNQDLMRLQQQKQQAREQERQHLSRELHDEIGQNLTACKLSLQMQHSSTKDEDARNKLAGTVALVDKIISHTRDLTQSLRPPRLDELGLFVALDKYLEELRGYTDVELESQWPAELTDELQEHRELIFRLVQEAVNNALKHANARAIYVTITQSSRSIRVTVTDDGEGVETKVRDRKMASGQHLGLLGMRERLYEVGGEFKFESSVGHGSSVSARIPI